MVTFAPSISALMVSCGLTRGLSWAMANDAATSDSEIRRLRRKCFMAKPAMVMGIAPAKKMKTILIFLLFGIQTSLLADTAAWRLNHERDIITEFSDLLSIPNLASDSANIQRNAEAVRAMCEKRKLTARLLTIDGAPPVVVADLPAPNAKRTIAFYAHYDGQPVDPSQWKSDPWKPVVRDRDGKDVDWHNAKSIDPEWRLFGRSSGDDKAAIIAMLAALDAMNDQHTKPAVNLRFFFE